MSKEFVHIYQSIAFYNHKVYKYRGMVPTCGDVQAWIKHYQEGGTYKAFTVTKYIGDRINEDLSVFEG